MKLCPICSVIRSVRGGMCRPCQVSYDKTAHRDGSVLEAMIWAANRARRFATPNHSEDGKRGFDCTCNSRFPGVDDPCPVHPREHMTVSSGNNT